MNTDRAAIFYYPWYSTPTSDGAWAHWYVERGGAPVLSTPFFPTRGLYSSSNASVVAAHMREIARVGVDTVVVSWWGPGSPEDQRLRPVADIARRFGLEVAIHLEPYIGRTPSLAADDIVRLKEAGFADFYVYDADRDSAADWAEVLAPVEDVRRFDGLHAVVARLHQPVAPPQHGAQGGQIVGVVLHHQQPLAARRGGPQAPAG